MGLAFTQYANANRNLWPVLYWTDASGNLNSHWTFEKYPLEVMLSPYLGRTLEYQAAYGAGVVGGGIWICPASPVSTGPTPQYPSATLYVWSGENGDHLFSNSYQGLYSHGRSDVSWKPVPDMTPPIPSWRPKYFWGYESQSPLQWCSTWHTPMEPAIGGIGKRSWHYPDGRPTLFVDGHAAVLMNEFYQGDHDHIVAANAVPGGVHAYVQPWGPDWAYQASHYATSEY